MYAAIYGRTINRFMTCLLRLQVFHDVKLRCYCCLHINPHTQQLLVSMSPVTS